MPMRNKVGLFCILYPSITESSASFLHCLYNLIFGLHLSPAASNSEKKLLLSKVINLRLKNLLFLVALLAPVAMSSPHHHSFDHRENRINKSSDIGKVSKSIFPVSSGTSRRPWPSRKVSESEEVVRYMSSVPSYLQREENVHNIQEMALNIGVLDWRRLQKWTGHEIFVANKTCHESPSSSYASSMFSTFHSSSLSSRSNAIPPTQRKQSSAFDHHHCSNSSSASHLGGGDQRKSRRKVPNACTIKSQPEDIICLPSASINGSEHFAFVHSRANRDAAGSELEKARISTEQESCRPHLYSDGGRTNSLHLTAKDRQNRFEEHISGRTDAAVLDCGSPRKMSSNRFFGIFPLSPQSSAHKAKEKASFERGGESSPSTSHLKGSEISDFGNVAVTRSRSRGKRSPITQMCDPPRQSTSSVASMSEYPDAVGSRCGSKGKRSPMKWLFDPSRNSASSMDPISSNPDVVGGRSSSRGRRSPLKKMFDPPRLSSASVSSTQQSHEPSGIVNLPPDSGDTSVAYARRSPSRRQALLKLSWKNGLPLLMFSSNDDNILVATMHGRGNSDMNICDCVFVIHTALTIEAKKEDGAWLSHGTKGKEPEFACKFVAELIVSCSERVSFDLSHRSFVKEFVLLGDELSPTNRAGSICLSSTELAAIVVETSHQKSGSSRCAVLCECSLCIQRIVAILPSGAHGFSNSREPSTLIERWESGGSCDCGGWDEGCALTILTNNSQELNDSTTDGIRGFDLFTEGDARKGKHSFSMIAFKGDMFTVEFKASIPLLQAFAMSIAMLHDQKSYG